ncbi:Uncharacterised protein [Salmonella bongori]|nr:Uncharacterised protein [Salmonella bongori]
MNVHPRTQYNFTRNIGRLRHLYNLAENQLLDRISGNFTTRQQLADDHLTEINRGNTMKCRRLPGKGGSQSTDNSNAVRPDG